jgi:hypothetical protein
MVAYQRLGVGVDQPGGFSALPKPIPGQNAESNRSFDGNLEPLKRLELNHSGFFALSLTSLAWRLGLTG